MLTYSYNLRELGFNEEAYKEIEAKALVTARRASAVDTGMFKNGWRVSLRGDILDVSNGVRYAPPVELGSILYTTHRYKVRRALSSIGLSKGNLSLGKGSGGSFTANNKTPTTTGTTPSPSATPSIDIAEVIRNPAILANIPTTRPRARVAVPRPVSPTRRARQLYTPNSNLFNRAFLLGAIAVQQSLKEEELEEEDL